MSRPWMLVRDRAELWAIGCGLLKSPFKYRLLITVFRGREFARIEAVS